MKLTQQDHSRYNRHLILSEVGEAGQLKLKTSKVLVIGAGGLGCPILQYLTAAGVGNIGIVDFDVVDESNLQRQILFGIDDIGNPKVLAAKSRLNKLNPLVQIDAFNEKLSAENAERIFSNYDLIIDGSDNFSTRYLVNDVCIKQDKPLVYGSIYKFEGQVSVFNYKNGPSYRCLFPTPPQPGSVPSCSEIGVIGVLPGIIGTQQANEALKIILDIGEPLSGHLLIYNALSANYQKFQISKNVTEINKIKSEEFIIKNHDYDLFCGLQPNPNINQIDLSTFKTALNNPDYFIVDVREDWETPKIQGTNVLNIPLDEIDDELDQIPKHKPVILFCQTGGRSANAIEYLQANYNFKNLFNLETGVKNQFNK